MGIPSTTERRLKRGRTAPRRSLGRISDPLPSELRLVPLDIGGYDEFWSLFQQAMPANADEVVAGLGIDPEEYERLPRETGELRQIRCGGDTTGYVWLEVRGRELHVHALLLRPEYRGRGLAGRLLELLVTMYREEVDVVELGVEPGNIAARTVYERAGFEYVGERLGFLVMRRRLRGDQANAERAAP